MDTDIAIIGGGLAGLTAASLLHEAGVDVMLLEARERLGGRILSVGQPNGEQAFDLGPSWFWPQGQPGLARLVQKLGLMAFAQHLDGDMLLERTPGAPPMRYPTMGQHPPSMRIAGGTASLIQALAQTLPSDRLRLNAPVGRLTLAKDGVSLSAPDETLLLRAGQIIVALPPRLAAATLSFSPALEPRTALLWRQTATWMAPHAKVFALYDRPFWRDLGLSGAAHSAVGPMGEIHDATSAAGSAALFGFVGVSAAQRAVHGEGVIVEACIDQLARLFGPQARAPIATLYKDWTADPATATDDDVVAGAHLSPAHAPWVSGPWAQRLILAGSETSDTEPGYLAGAVQAAERAVGQILNAKTPSPTAQA
jgi:monoamine oxidase